MTGVVERPEALVPGAEWVVEFHALGQSWRSRSQLEDFDRERRRFVYRSATDDGNPSYADWDWTVQPDGSGSGVSVTVALHPETFWRKYLLVHLRRPALRREMRASLAALAATESQSP
jgi:hypothetical protein